MLTYSQRGYPTTVEISDDFFWNLYFFLKSVLEGKEDTEKYESRCGTKLEINGKIYEIYKVREAYAALDQYIHRTGINSARYTQRQELEKKSMLDAMLDDSFLELSSIHKPEMEFMLWSYILPLVGAFEPIDSEDSCASDVNDWTLPDNFRDGTDDEKEIWENSR